MLIFSILSAQVADTLSEASSGGDFLVSPLFALLALVGVAVGAFIVVYLVSRVLPKLITLICVACLFKTLEFDNNHLMIGRQYCFPVRNG